MKGDKQVTESSSMKSGEFIAELKNRFLCTVSVAGETVTCYIPSSCRLSNFMDLTGKTVLLKPISSPNARTSYSLYAIKYRNQFILLNMAQVNRVVFDALGTRRFSFLGKRKKVSREYSIEGYRTDLFVHDSHTLIEIKGVLSFDRSATFPTVYSERAEKQLQKIVNLLDRGYHACYAIVSMNPGVHEVRINPCMTGFYRLFCECITKGMTTCAVSITLRDGIPFLKRSIPVIHETMPL